MPSQVQSSIWRKFFLSNKKLDSSNIHFQIKKASTHSVSFTKSFEEFLKNDGISFLILDPTESHLQLLHHGQVLGGSWDSPAKKLYAILSCDADARPVQIVKKSIKNIKEKSFGLQDFQENLKSEEDFLGLSSPDPEFLFKNIIPIPNGLNKIFIQLESTTPYSVAKAFLESSPVDAVSETSLIMTAPPSIDQDSENTRESDTGLLGFSLAGENVEGSLESQTKKIGQLSLEDILYVIQFCHLCAKKKVPPVIYSLAGSDEVNQWFKSVCNSLTNKRSNSSKRLHPSTPDSDDDSAVPSPDQKMSRKDHYLINTMIKLHDTMDKTSKSKEDKEPGFSRLESHRKNLILNASALPPFTTAAEKPTEFFMSFLAKKSQFKAKDMLLHRFHSDKVSFNPNTTFVTNLWNSEFFWILPDSPTGISIFYCPETKSSNSYELEKERNLALADKVNTSDIEKLAKQKISLPTSLMDLVWTVQNFHAVISLCFGPSSHLASLLKSWADHIYDNRILYSNMQSSDQCFYAKIMFTIDRALQTHWRSCSSQDERASVNDNVLRMSDIHDSILSLQFNQMLPKLIADKVQAAMNTNKEDKGSGFPKGGKKLPGANQDQKDKQDLVYDSDKNHSQWRIKEGENFSKLFYTNQKECPKTSDGKLICMKISTERSLHEIVQPCSLFES
jgi:hypothetical protein